MSGISGFKLAQQEAAIKKNASDKASGPSYTVGTWAQNDLGYVQSQLPSVNIGSQPLIGALFSLGGILFSMFGNLFSGNKMPEPMSQSRPNYLPKTPGFSPPSGFPPA